MSSFYRVCTRCFSVELLSPFAKSVLNHTRNVQSLDLIIIYCPNVFLLSWFHVADLFTSLFPFSDYSTFLGFGEGSKESGETVVCQTCGITPSLCVSDVYLHIHLPFLENKAAGK